MAHLQINAESFPALCIITAFHFDTRWFNCWILYGTVLTIFRKINVMQSKSLRWPNLTTDLPNSYELTTLPLVLLIKIETERCLGLDSLWSWVIEKDCAVNLNINSMWQEIKWLLTSSQKTYYHPWLKHLY